MVERIANHLPEAKLIYIVRHPVQRIESDFVQLLDNGHQFDSLDTAIKEWKPLVDSSCYWARINDFRQYFSDDQILVLFMDDLSKDPDGVLKKCFEFLAVDPTFSLQKTQPTLNSRSTKQTDYPWMAWLRQQRLFLDAKWLMPTWLISRLKPLFRKPIKVDIQWQDETRQTVNERLREDSAEFLTFYGKPEGYWQL